jgi:hypothetical protein
MSKSIQERLKSLERQYRNLCCKTQDLKNIISNSSSGGLEGTQYVFVTANGTDIENAAELQAAYNLAETKIEIVTNQSDLIQDAFLGNPIFMASSGFQYFNYAAVPPNLISEGVQSVDIINDGVSLTIEIDVLVSGQFEVVYLNLSGLDLSNITSLIYSTNTVKPATVIAASGYYNFEADFQMDTQYVNLVSLDGNRSIVFNGLGTISATANNVFIKGVDTQDKAFIIGNNLNRLKVENCKGGNDSFGSPSGTFINCQGGQFAFGGFGIASGTFIDCVGEYGSFGGIGIASGTFIDCVGEYGSFGGIGIASGTFTNCKGGSQSFGSEAEASGTFRDCQGGDWSFGGNYGIASGIFNNCVGGNESFGGNFGILSGQLYYCRLTSGTFEVVQGAGITRLCIDGSNVENNQG